MSYPSYRISRKVKNWKRVQELAERSRVALRPLADRLCDPSLPTFDLDDLQVPDLDSLPTFDLDPFDHRGKEEKP